MTETDNTTLINNANYSDLLHNIGDELELGRKRVVVSVNSAMVETYWHIGQHIVEYEQKGNDKAEYGSDILNKLSHDLTVLYGKGFSHSNLIYIRKFYLIYKKVRQCLTFYPGHIMLNY